MYESINENLRLKFYNNPAVQSRLAEAERAVLDGQKTSFVAAQELLDGYYNSIRDSQHGQTTD